MERDTQWIKHNEHGSVSSVGRGEGEKNGENNIWQGFDGLKVEN